MVYDERLIKFIVNQPLKLSPDVIKKNASAIPPLFQASLLVDLEMGPERISEIFFDLILQLTPFDMALLYMWDASEILFCRGIQGNVPDSIDHGNIFTHNIRNTAKPMLIHDIAQSSLDPEELPFTFSSMIGLPIYLDTSTVGGLELYRKKGNPFDTDEIILIKHLLLCSERVLKGLSDIDTFSDKASKVRIDAPKKDVIPNILHRYSEQAKRLLSPLSIAVIAIKDPSELILSDVLNEGLRPLEVIAEKLREALRCYDNVLRYEEMSFLVILPGCSSDDAIATLGKAISALNPDLTNNMVVGLATLPEEAQDAKGLINGALQALSYAKKNDLSLATFTHTGTIKADSLSLELTINKILSLPPSIDSLNKILEQFARQCHAEFITIKSSPPGKAVHWRGHTLGYVKQKGISKEIYNRIITYLAPAWALASKLDADIDNWYKAILTLVSLLSDIRAGYPPGYSLIVADDIYTLARAIGKDENLSQMWALSALGVNIGYLGIPSYIFTKSELNPSDMVRIKDHPILSARILKDTAILDLDTDILMYHHENIDGSGYPRGLEGDSIPLGARLLRVVDTFNASISPRVYRQEISYDKAISEINALSGSILDPDITSAFIGIIGS